jgi:hypothetical protein
MCRRTLTLPRQAREWRTGGLPVWLPGCRARNSKPNRHFVALRRVARPI